MIVSPPAPAGLRGADWEVDFYSRPVLEADGRKRWELLISSTPEVASASAPPLSPLPFRFEKRCSADTVNSQWLREALAEALDVAQAEGRVSPGRLRCWRGSMRAMVERAAAPLGLEVLPSRRCFSLMEWLGQREREIYPAEEGYMAGPLAPPPQPQRPVPLAWPEVARGDSWSWAMLPLESLADAPDWSMGFGALLPLPSDLDPQGGVPGIRLFSRQRALAIAGWLAGLEPVRLELDQGELVLEAGLDDRWRLARLADQEASAIRDVFSRARQDAGGLQFLAVQTADGDSHFEGFWMLRDLPDG